MKVSDGADQGGRGEVRCVKREWRIGGKWDKRAAENGQGGGGKWREWRRMEQGGGEILNTGVERKTHLTSSVTR